MMSLFKIALFFTSLLFIGFGIDVGMAAIYVPAAGCLVVSIAIET